MIVSSQLEVSLAYCVGGSVIWEGKVVVHAVPMGKEVFTVLPPVSASPTQQKCLQSFLGLEQN